MALKKLNPWITDAQIAEAHQTLSSYLSSASLLQINEEKYFMIRDGIPVTVKKPNGKTEEKKAIVDNAKKEVKKYEEQVAAGAITQDDRRERVIAVWSKADADLSKIMMDKLAKDKDGFNTIYMMATSGARGSKKQISQLAAMRGLMQRPNGEIIELRGHIQLLALQIAEGHVHGDAPGVHGPGARRRNVGGELRRRGIMQGLLDPLTRGGGGRLGKAEVGEREMLTIPSDAAGQRTTSCAGGVLLAEQKLRRSRAAVLSGKHHV